MEIEDKGIIDNFENMPTEGFLYLSVVKYEGNYWASGPSSTDKNEVITMLQSYTGVVLARIYKVKVPVKSFPSA